MGKDIVPYKKQQEALDGWVKALTKEKKEKDNVLIDLELMNLKSVSMLNYEELRRRIIKVEKRN